MYRIIRRAGFLPALLAVLLAGTTTPASAATAAGGVFNGTVTFAPGLTTTPTFQSFTYSNNLTVGTFVNSAGAVFVGCISVASVGSSTIAETVLVGQGAFPRLEQ
jgi:hypothetical protein